MASHAFGALIDVESSASNSEVHGPSEVQSTPIAPQKAFPRTYHSVPQVLDAIELDNLQWGAELNGPHEPAGHTPPGSQTPQPVNDAEISEANTAEIENEGVYARQSFSNPPMNRYRMLASCLMIFGNGMSDSAPGALIPYIEKYYHIGYALLSVIFIANALGFILAAFVVDALRGHLGRARTLVFAQMFLICGYVAIVCTPPFPVVVVCFFLLGFGMAIGLAIFNVFAANLQNGTNMLGAIHGCYGVGGTVGPLIATTMVTSGSLVWSRFYLLPLCAAIFNIAFAPWSFWHYEEEAGQSLLGAEGRTSNDATGASVQFSNMKKAFKSRIVILGALFIFAYQGAEVSISGWVISFLISTRHGNPSHVGYVTSGFWAGITLGRFLLSHPAHKVGEKIFVYFVVVGAAVFELLVWQVPNVIGDAVAVAIVGLLLGPVYPCATAIFSRAIGRKEQVSSLSVISAFGSSGGAFAPFITGLLAQVVGTFVLHPIAIGLFAVMLACWFALPQVRKRTD